MIKITDDMKQRIERALEEKNYCVWATTSQEGYSDLSFRGSTFVYDDEHLAFWDRSLGQSTTNLERNPHVCMLYYDQPGRTGWRFFATFVFFVCSFEKDFEGMLLQHGQVFGPYTRENGYPG